VERIRRRYGIRKKDGFYFSGLVGEVCGRKGWRGDEEGLGPEGREFLPHGVVLIGLLTGMKGVVAKLPETYALPYHLYTYTLLPNPVLLMSPTLHDRPNTLGVYKRALQKGERATPIFPYSPYSFIQRRKHAALNKVKHYHV
jgi:hypothetical protein